MAAKALEALMNLAYENYFYILGAIGILLITKFGKKTEDNDHLIQDIDFYDE